VDLGLKDGEGIGKYKEKNRGLFFSEDFLDEAEYARFLLFRFWL